MTLPTPIESASWLAIVAVFISRLRRRPTPTTEATALARTLQGPNQ